MCPKPPLATASATTAGPDTAVFASLPAVGYLEFEGADTASFLQGQLSNEVIALAIGEAQWTSYNSPKGRMLATMLLWHASATSYRAFVAADIAEWLRKRLAMFVMRARVVVTDRTAGGTCFGIAGGGAVPTVRAALGAAEAAGHGVTHDGLDIVTTPDGRVLVYAAAAAGDDTGQRLAAQATHVDATHWDWHGIAAGIPVVAAATQDHFIAQAANWELVGGVNFRKGCYPGQEIIARMQYLGKLKERLVRLHHDGPAPAAGTPLFSPVFGDQACGTVVNAAPAPDGGSDMLAVAQTSATAGGTLHLGQPEGPVLALLTLPYAVPAPAAPHRPKLA
jgi:folate-binding protein YgfZ